MTFKSGDLIVLKKRAVSAWQTQSTIYVVDCVETKDDYPDIAAWDVSGKIVDNMLQLHVFCVADSGALEAFWIHKNDVRRISTMPPKKRTAHTA